MNGEEKLKEQDAWKASPYETFGKQLVEHIIGVGVATTAAQRIMEARSQEEAFKALGVLVSIYNGLATDHAMQMGWTSEQLLKAQSAVQAAYAGRLVKPMLEIVKH